MPKRVIDGDALWVSEKLTLVPEKYRAEYAWIIPLTQGNGCFECSPRLIWRTCYSALRTDWVDADVAAMLDEFEKAKMLFRFQQDGKTYGFFVGVQKEGRLPPPSLKLRTAKQWQAGMLPEAELADFLGVTVEKVRKEYRGLLQAAPYLSQEEIKSASCTDQAEVLSTSCTGIGIGIGIGIGTGIGTGTGSGEGGRDTSDAGVGEEHHGEERDEDPTPQTVGVKVPEKKPAKVTLPPVARRPGQATRPSHQQTGAATRITDIPDVTRELALLILNSAGRESVPEGALKLAGKHLNPLIEANGAEEVRNTIIWAFTGSNPWWKDSITSANSPLAYFSKSYYSILDQASGPAQPNRPKSSVTDNVINGKYASGPYKGCPYNPEAEIPGTSAYKQRHIFSLPPED